MTKTIISEKWELVPLELRKIARSFFYGCLALLAFLVAEYLTQYGLPERFSYLAPFLPVVINSLAKWAREHKYVVKE